MINLITKVKMTSPLMLKMGLVLMGLARDYDQDYLHDDSAHNVQDDVNPPVRNPEGDVPIVNFCSMLTLCAEHGNHISLDCVHCESFRR